MSYSLAPIRFVACLLCAACLAGANNLSAQTTTAASADLPLLTAEVGQFLDADEKAHRDRDIKALGELYDDALLNVFDWPGQKDATVLNKKDALECIERAWKNPNLHIKAVQYLSREIHVTGDLALISAIQSVVSEGKPEERTSYLLIAVKREKGWKACLCMSPMFRLMLLVTKVFPDSRAEEAGLKVGDALLAYEGTNIVNVAELRFLADQNKNAPKRKKLSITVLRDGKEMKLPILPGQLGAEFSARLVPAGEAKLLPAGQPHPVKELFERVTKAVNQDRKYEVGFASMNPNGFIGISPGSPTQIFTAARMREILPARMEQADKQIDLAATQIRDLQVICGTNVAILGGSSTVKLRKDGSTMSSPTGLQIFVQKNGTWYLAAGLGFSIELGLNLTAATEKK